MLTNPRSDRVKAVRALSRRSVRSRTGEFLAEGPQAVREAVVHRPDLVRDVYVTPEAAERHTDIVDAARAARLWVHDVSPEVLAAMCDTESPQGIAAVCRVLDVSLAAALADLPPDAIVCVLTNVRDPGNAGTVIRGADAAGADAVIVSDASVDVYNNKVVRSTVGSLWHLPIATGVPVPVILSALRERGITLLAADGAGQTLLHDVDLGRPHAWVMGNEAWGLEPEVREACDEVVRVPIYGHAESLNLAMAATVCLYASAEARRRRR
ncbi:RNA methyltransferase [Intrasporangium oryzae NRRL B-24470]|uniref:RNA methyltransferase n=1 Tax=Intrasporangium oryzae NRRL B-24470 TaxID=1386089 RepID=W9G8P5_9MICO|nr:RNA methyltransferase [Intrasporangium oryzae]EWT01198.1 RNA methyltransferase [Intrasporangium oryzae NRRL B-24470]